VIPAYGIWDGGEAELQKYLNDVESWAESARDLPEPWHEVAEAMAAGLAYE
jgi:hypothetical protein